MDNTRLYNTTYARYARLHSDTARADYYDYEGALIDAHDFAVKHVAAVAIAHNKALASKGIPMWPHLARPMAIVSMEAYWAQQRITVCGKCAGSGVWSQKTARTNIDGSTVPATCYACSGKGKQNEADRRRNWGYHQFYARVSA